MTILQGPTVSTAGSLEEAKSAFGRGDHAMAAQLFRSLAEQGEARAQNNPEGMYTQGLCVPRDFIRAHMWFTVAAAALSENAGRAVMKNRDHVASQMTAAQIEKVQEMARHCEETKFKECNYRAAKPINGWVGPTSKAIGWTCNRWGRLFQG